MYYASLIPKPLCRTLTLLCVLISAAQTNAILAEELTIKEGDACTHNAYCIDEFAAIVDGPADPENKSPVSSLFCNGTDKKVYNCPQGCFKRAEGKADVCLGIQPSQDVSASGLTILSFNKPGGSLDMSGLTKEWSDVVVYTGSKVCPGKVKKRGSTADQYYKKNLKIKFDCDKDNRPVLMGKARKEVVLNASFQDYSFLRNFIVMKTLRKIADRYSSANTFGKEFVSVAPDTEFVQMRVNYHEQGKGQTSLYQVIHDPKEHILDKNQKFYIGSDGKELSKSDMDLGIFKAQNHLAWPEVNRDDLDAMRRAFEDKGTGGDISHVANAIQNFCNGQDSISRGHYYLFNFVHHYFGNSDTWTKNYYMFWSRNQGKWAIYNWDADLTLGLHCVNGCSEARVSDEYINDFKWGSGGGLLCFERNPAKGSYNDFYKDALRQELRPEILIPELESMYRKIASSIQRDLEIWPRNFWHGSADDAFAELKRALSNRDAIVRSRINP